MKKTLCGILVVLLLMGLSGCGGKITTILTKDKSEPSEVSVVDQLKTVESTPSKTVSSKAPTPSFSISKDTTKPNVTLPLPSSPTGFYFSSGAGAWGTSLDLNKDGTFSGEYGDMDAGDSGEGYMATKYIATFTGRFTNIQQINDYSYRMHMTELTTYETKDEWIEDKVRYIASGAYGLDGGFEFILYCPQTPIQVLSEELISWHPDRSELEDGRITLDWYSVYNVSEGHAFFS